MQTRQGATWRRRARQMTWRPPPLGAGAPSPASYRSPTHSLPPTALPTRAGAARRRRAPDLAELAEALLEPALQRAQARAGELRPLQGRLEFKDALLKAQHLLLPLAQGPRALARFAVERA